MMNPDVLDIMVATREDDGRRRWIEIVDQRLRTSAVSVVIGVGSADEPAALGLTHLLEHCFMASAPNGDRSLATSVGRIGGLITATTGRDTLTISAHVAPEDLVNTCDLILERIRVPVASSIVEAERGAVIQELETLALSARRRFEMRLNEVTFPGPFGRPPGGSIAAVRLLDAQAVEQWRGYATASDMVVVTASPNPLYWDYQKHIAGLTDASASVTNAPQWRPTDAPQLGSPTSTYVGLGTSLPTLSLTDAAALRVLTTLLGQTPVSTGLRTIRATGGSYLFDAWDVPYRLGMSWRFLARTPRGEARRIGDQVRSGLSALAHECESFEVADARRYATAKARIRWENSKTLVESVATNVVTPFAQGWSPNAWLEALNNVEPESVARMAAQVLDTHALVVDDEDV